jgi:single-strand DNA-binding protein
MPSLNKVMLMGNLTRDPEVRHTPKGSAVADFAIAVNRTWTNDNGQKQEEVTFVDVVLWARLAEIASQYLTKGSPVFVEGRLQLEQWDDKQTGQKRSRMRVVGESLQMLGGKKEGEGQSPRQEQRQRPTAQAQQRQAPATSDGMDDQDIPF